MKTLFRNSILLLVTMFALSSCMKEELDNIRSEQANQAQRLASLEAWATTVNNNISSLQTLLSAIEESNYITGIAPVMQGGVEIGQTVSFSKSGPVTIYHGANGTNGTNGTNGVDGTNGTNGVDGTNGTNGVDGTNGTNGVDGTNGTNGADGTNGTNGNTPKISIKQAEDNEWYWTQQIGSGAVEWILDGSDNKMRATGVKGDKGDQGAAGSAGADAIAPQIRINTSSKMWEISTDNGTSWTSTDVVAEGVNGAAGAAGQNGSQGAQGPQGDAIFATNGVDNTNADYVEFTLADGTTKIQVPKYKSIGISFTQPELFLAGVPQEILYTSLGNPAPTSIRIVDLPTGWKCVVNITAKTITVTPPTTWTVDNIQGEATILIGADNQVAGMYVLQLISKFTGVFKNEVGAIYYQQGVAAGIVYVVNTGTPGTGRVVSLDETNKAWSTEYSNTGTGTTDGAANMTKISTYLTDNSEPWSTFPAFEWVYTTKNSSSTTPWYLPAKDELLALYAAWNGGQGSTEVNDMRTTFNGWLSAAGGTNMTSDWYWSSSENANASAWIVSFGHGFTGGDDKVYGHLGVRVVLAF